jgi:hypothetical protein
MCVPRGTNLRLGMLIVTRNKLLRSEYQLAKLLQRMILVNFIIT